MFNGIFDVVVNGFVQLYLLLIAVSGGEGSGSFVTNLDNITFM